MILTGARSTKHLIKPLPAELRAMKVKETVNIMTALLLH